MPDNFNINETINVIFEKLENFFQTKTVVGEPIKVGEITLVPFIDVSFGLGTGGGDGVEEKGNKGTGGGAGSGGRISPTAVLVIKDGETELLPIKKGGSLERLIDLVPGIVDKVKESKRSEEDKA